MQWVISFEDLSKAITKDFRGAIQDFSKAKKLDSRLAEVVYGSRGLSKSSIGDHHGAIQDHNKAIKINPKLADAYFYRGESKASTKDYRGAIQDYSKTISLEPNNLLAYKSRGRVKRELCDYIGAIKDFDAAIKIDSGYLSSYNDRGYTKFISDDVVGAIRDYKRIIKNKQHSKSFSINERLERLNQYLLVSSKKIEILSRNIIPAFNNAGEKLLKQQGAMIVQAGISQQVSSIEEGQISKLPYAPNRKYQVVHFETFRDIYTKTRNEVEAYAQLAKQYPSEIDPIKEDSFLVSYRNYLKSKGVKKQK